MPNTIIRNPKLGHGAFRLYTVLLCYAWQDGFCFPGQERLAKDMGIGVRMVYQYMKELEAAGLVRVQHRPLHKGVNKTNVYTFTAPDDTDCSQPSTSSTDRQDAANPDRQDLADNEDAVDENPISPLGPPKGANPEGKAKAGSVRGPSETSSLGAGRDHEQNRAGEGRVKERSPRKRRPRGGVTSPAGIEAILSYEARRDTYDPIGLTMEKRSKQLALVAERWDFASEEDPPMKLRYEISSDRNDCDRMLKRLRRMTSQAIQDSPVQAKKLIPYDYIPPASPSDASEAPVTDADGRSLPPADRQTVQAAVLEAVEGIEDF